MRGVLGDAFGVVVCAHGAHPRREVQGEGPGPSQLSVQYQVLVRRSPDDRRFRTLDQPAGRVPSTLDQFVKPAGWVLEADRNRAILPTHQTLANVEMKMR